MNLETAPSPCFVLDEALLLRNLELLQRVQRQAGVEIICALKGFSMYSVFPTLKQYLAGATASSLHEARLIHEYMGTRAHTYLPAYLENELEELIALSGHLTFNSWGQLERYGPRVSAAGVSVGIRVNPQYSEVTTDLYNPAIPGSRLGVVRAALPEVLPAFVQGLHVHALCENNSYTLERLLEVMYEKFDGLLRQVQWLNLGGGHLITHKDYDPQHLVQVLQQLRARYPHLHVILEPGSAIGWETGVLLTSVVHIFESQGINVAMLDTSFANHMPDTLEMPYRPRVQGAVPERLAGKHTYTLGGLTCLAGDFMPDYSFDTPLKIGDRVIFEDMIHYTMVKTTTFNGVNLPAIAISHTDGTFEVVKRFGYESYKERL